MAADDATAAVERLQAELRETQERYAASQAALAASEHERATLAEELASRDAALAEAHEQQAATSEVLRVIAASPANLDAVLQTLVETAARICDAPSSVIVQVRESDGLLAQRASFGIVRDRQAAVLDDPASEAIQYPPRRDSIAGRVILEGQTLHLHDMAEAVRSEFQASRRGQERDGHWRRSRSGSSSRTSRQSSSRWSRRTATR